MWCRVQAWHQGGSAVWWQVLKLQEKIRTSRAEVQARREQYRVRGSHFMFIIKLLAMTFYFYLQTALKQLESQQGDYQQEMKNVYAEFEDKEQVV